MSCDVGEVTERLENEHLSVTSPTSQLILQPFRLFTYVTDHSPTLPLLHLRHSSFSNPSFASPTSQALHLIHLVSRPWTAAVWRYFFIMQRKFKSHPLIFIIHFCKIKAVVHFKIQYLTNLIYHVNQNNTGKWKIYSKRTPKILEKCPAPIWWIKYIGKNLQYNCRPYLYGGEGWLGFLISVLVKNPDGTDI